MPGELGQRRHGHVLGVDLEVAAQRQPGVGQAVSIGSERYRALRYPTPYRVGYRLGEVRDGDDRARLPTQHLRDVRHSWWLEGVQSFPPLAREGVGT